MADPDPLVPGSTIMDAGGAIVLAGGGGRRLGGVDKPGLTRDGTRLLDVVLDAVRPADPGAFPVVVVGPARDLPDGVIVTREDPPGSGPAAAVAAGFAAARWRDGPLVLAAADLPNVRRSTVRRLLTALIPGSDAAVLLDDTGHRQLLLAAWHQRALRAAVEALPDGGRGRPLRELYAGCVVVEVPGHDHEWVDVDTPDDRARWWTSG